MRPETVCGLKPHADGSAITNVLPYREMGGLQFLKDGQGFKIPIIPPALLINVGDQVDVRTFQVSSELAFMALCSSFSPEGYVL